eukprot:g19686.t1
MQYDPAKDEVLPQGGPEQTELDRLVIGMLNPDFKSRIGTPEILQRLMGYMQTMPDFTSEVIEMVSLTPQARGEEPLPKCLWNWDRPLRDIGDQKFTREDCGDDSTERETKEKDSSNKACQCHVLRKGQIRSHEVRRAARWPTPSELRGEHVVLVSSQVEGPFLPKFYAGEFWWGKRFPELGQTQSRQRIIAGADAVVFPAQATRDLWAESEMGHTFHTFFNFLDLARIHQRAGAEAAGAYADVWSLTERRISPLRASVRAELGVAEETFVLVAVGTICQRKNQIALVQPGVLKILSASFRKWLILLVGADDSSPSKRHPAELSPPPGIGPGRGGSYACVRGMSFRASIGIYR